MVLTESEFWKSKIKPLVSGRDYCQFTRIENKDMKGMPDIHFSFRDIYISCITSGWIELKIGKVVKRRDNGILEIEFRHELTVSQESFLRIQKKCGQKAYVLCYFPKEKFTILKDINYIKSNYDYLYAYFIKDTTKTWRPYPKTYDEFIQALR